MLPIIGTDHSQTKRAVQRKWHKVHTMDTPEQVATHLARNLIALAPSARTDARHAREIRGRAALDDRESRIRPRQSIAHRAAESREFARRAGR